MKKMTAILMVMTVVLSAMTGCSPQPVENNDVGKEEENKIVMYTNAEFAPFEYFEGENIVGADVDIANEIAKDLGKELIVEHTDFDGIIPAIKSGKAHIGAAAMTITEARQEEVDFSIGYVTSIQNIQIPKYKEIVKYIEDVLEEKERTRSKDIRQKALRYSNKNVEL